MVEEEVEEVEEVAEDVVMEMEGDVEEESEDEAGVSTMDLAMRRGAGYPEKDPYEPGTQHQQAYVHNVFSDRPNENLFLDEDVLDRGREVPVTPSGSGFAWNCIR